jgi:hypothetical protein
VARGIFGNIFENPRASYKYVGCRLILEKMRGQSAKCQEMRFSRNYFVEEKPVDQVHGSVDRAGPINHGLAAISTRRSSPTLDGGSRGGGVGHEGLSLGLTGAQEAVEWRHDGGEGGGGGVLSAGLLRAWREGMQGWGRTGDERGCRGTIL